MDCLDRTNITQTVLSNYIFTRLFFEEQRLFIDIKQFEKESNWIWWENGNALSLFNAGTNSLKSDILM
jgi:hypothetical protein